MKLILGILLVFVAKCNTLHNNFLWYDNITVPDPNTICSSFRNASISVTCSEQLQIVCENQTLFFDIFDASAKFPYSGLTYSTREDYGNFDQCMSVEHSYRGGRILGEFCAYGLIIPDINNLDDFNSFFKLAVCRPDGCQANDYNVIVNYLLSLPEDSQGLFADGLCQTKQTSSTYTAGDITVITIFGIVIVLMIVSTVYDYYLDRKGLESFHPLCLAFSVLSNSRKLLHISKHSTSKEQIEVFHGLRVISMIWIVAGHGYAMWQFSSASNAKDVSTWLLKFSSFHMSAAPLAVDTFFFMSGFLLAFQYFKGNTRTFKEQIFSVPHMIVHRYLRLTPAMLMIYLVMITVFSHLGSGPLWSAVVDAFNSPCRNYWWRFFLYIQNYYDFTEICLTQTWYLSADMQLFLISPLIIIPLSLVLKTFGFKCSVLGLMVLNIIWTVLPMVTKLVFTDYTNNFDTHSRLIDYFIGVMLGFFMKIKISKPFLYMVNGYLRSFINLVNWFVVILGMLAVVLCYQDQSVNHGFESITVFQSLMRSAWCIGLSWITYSCYHAQGGFVNWILCRPIFQVLGKLTYSIYLVHITVMLYYMGTSRTKLFFTEYIAFYQFCGHYVVSIIVATFWSLVFESPLIVIEKYLLGGVKPVRKEKTLKNRSVEEGPQ